MNQRPVSIVAPVGPGVYKFNGGVKCYCFCETGDWGAVFFSPTNALAVFSVKTKQVLCELSIESILSLIAINESLLLVICRTESTIEWIQIAVPDGGEIRRLSLPNQGNSNNYFRDDYCVNLAANSLVWCPRPDGEGGGRAVLIQLSDLAVLNTFEIADGYIVRYPVEQEGQLIWRHESQPRDPEWEVALSPDGQIAFSRLKDVKTNRSNQMVDVFLPGNDEQSTYHWDLNEQINSRELLIKWIGPCRILCHAWHTILSFRLLDIENSAPVTRVPMAQDYKEAINYKIASRIALSPERVCVAILAGPYSAQQAALTLFVFDTTTSTLVNHDCHLPDIAVNAPRSICWSGDGRTLFLALLENKREAKLYQYTIATGEVTQLGAVASFHESCSISLVRCANGLILEVCPRNNQIDELFWFDESLFASTR